jgi:hypothetical protein
MRIALYAAFVVLLLPAGRGTRADAADWATGSTLQRQLTTPVGVDWSGNPLRQALRGLSRAQRVAILVDRRVDPEQLLEIRLEDVPLGKALRQIAHDRQLDVSLLGAVVYFGPPQAAARLRALAASRAEEVRRLSPAVARRFTQSKAMAWADFATPRDILQQLAVEASAELAGIEQVPHDLWAAADLPPLSLVDRITLVAIQFDLTFDVTGGGRQISLTPIPADFAAGRSSGDGLPEGQEPVVPRRKPAGHVAKPATPGAKETQIDRLVIQEKPLGPVLEQLAAKLHIELRIDAKALQAAGISLDQRVSVQLSRATIDDAFRELLKATPLTYRRKGNVVEIVPR